MKLSWLKKFILSILFVTFADLKNINRDEFPLNQF